MVLSTMTITEVGVSPRGGGPGTNVTVPGSGFGASAGRVRFDPLGENVDATIVSWAPNVIVFTVPTLSARDRFVKVLISVADASDSIVMPFWYPLASPPALTYQWPNAEADTPNESADDPRVFGAADYNRQVDRVVVLEAGVPIGRQIGTTSPLTGGGDLSADRTIAFAPAAAKTALAGPASGAPAAPAFRQLSSDDLSDAANLSKNPKLAARVATTAALPTSVYANGTAGVGATIMASANGALTVDGVAVAANDLVLVKDEVTASRNGLYAVTQTGDAGTPFILTRSPFADAPPRMAYGDRVTIFDGSANLARIFVLTGNGTITVGTTALTWASARAGSTTQVDYFAPYLNNLVDGQTVFPLSKQPSDPSAIRFYNTGPGYAAAEGFFTYDANSNSVIWRNRGFTITVTPTVTDTPRIEYPV